ncbi:type I-E CRISPR-associated protein Cas6/Cse3/CasE, partial [Enterococcus sp. 2CBP]|uniref:type I-E CRISPR-associated protein Cas6/Cse3/CasE n=1 Tax=Enterococcus sp. 2CBP TaxID=2800793 RepID=UPI0028FD3D09
MFIMSPARPSMEQLQEECGWSQEPSWQTADYARFLDRLEGGQRWAFRLTANPTRSVAGEQDSRGRISPHVSERHQREWLLERAERHGFRIDGELLDALQLTRRERDS